MKLYLILHQIITGIINLSDFSFIQNFNSSQDVEEADEEEDDEEEEYSEDEETEDITTSTLHSIACEAIGNYTAMVCCSAYSYSQIIFQRIYRDLGSLIFPSYIPIEYLLLSDQSHQMQ